ncbi:MAG: holo-ACP synthase [Clostridia bacterium]|nr:holo-ACP synthase [Clostridia bacterium]
MIGIDILEVERVKDLSLEAGRVFTQREIDYIHLKGDALETIAGIFCAKEAVLKALGTGIGNQTGLCHVEVDHTPLGQPTVVLYGKAKDLLLEKGKEIFLSITHSKNTAVAVAVIK